MFLDESRGSPGIERKIVSVYTILAWPPVRKPYEVRVLASLRPLYRPDLQRAIIACISLSEQRHIVAYLDDLQTKIDSLKHLQAETAAELDALLPSILDKAFKGKL
jgi:hypothetical protein